MLDGLDKVPWHKLKHAYGTAEDVPGQIRGLLTAPKKKNCEDDPLWCLFGNIWHQGTVSEAAAYAAPFLIEVVAAPQTHDRAGVLLLLSVIASGYPQKPAAAARKAILAGYAKYKTLTKSADPKVRRAAASLLAHLPERAADSATILRGMLKTETIANERATLLWLLGVTADGTPATLALFQQALASDDPAQRFCGAAGLAHRKPKQLPDAAREVIAAAMVDKQLPDRFDSILEMEDTNFPAELEQLKKFVKETARDRVVAELIARLDAIRWKKDFKQAGEPVDRLLDLLFQRKKTGRRPKPLRPADLNPAQRRAVQAIHRVMAVHKQRISAGFDNYGLPRHLHEWKALAEGRELPPIDKSLPLIGHPKNPRQELPASKLRKGSRLHHRSFGLGKVTKIEDWEATEQDESRRYFLVAFDEAGEVELRL